MHLFVFCDVKFIVILFHRNTSLAVLFFKYSLNLVFYMYIMVIFGILKSDALFTRYVRNFKRVIEEAISSKSRSIIIGVFIINKNMYIGHCKV